MKICKNCRWWKRQEGGDDTMRGEYFGHIGYPDWWYPIGECFHDKLSDQLSHKAGKQKNIDALEVSSHDEHGGRNYALIFTGPEFGCIHWEKK